jgi:hypothetical protein
MQRAYITLHYKYYCVRPEIDCEYIIIIYAAVLLCVFCPVSGLSSSCLIRMRDQRLRDDGGLLTRLLMRK